MHFLEIYIMIKLGLYKDKLQEWTGHSTLISENLKIVEISKNNFNTIETSSKVVLIFKIWRVWLKN